MSRSVLFLLAFLSCLPATAGEAGPPVATTEQEKLSYAIGVLFARNLDLETRLDNEAFLQGIRDVLENSPLRYPVEELQQVVEKYRGEQLRIQEQKAQSNLEAGRKFLDANKSREGVTTLDSGLQYQIIQQGKGAMPELNDSVLVHYRGTLLSGKEFDSSYSRGEPTPLQLKGVIRGWQEALTRMPVGSKWLVYVPPQLAYGERAVGPDIEPNSTLIFEIELLGINN
ncbi:MAG: FKBP-type peptidyl-prolyl cis-trans isomerase [Gammaproteobacteria bacterium]|nr:FKBP-type peptidyl-prolyl cis-trans isomerase [Gammaproteobacteria bacterium]